jgi:hypothetical protein
MDHIEDGLALLKNWGVAQTLQDAWLLHPIMQDDNQYQEYLRIGPTFQCHRLAAKYRAIANAYLPKHAPRKPSISVNNGINELLEVDKLHNCWQLRKALRSNPEIYPNAARLEEYFRDWLDVLETSRYDEKLAFNLFDELDKNRLVSQ